MKHIAFIKKNIMYPGLPEEDSYRYSSQRNKIMITVADGITRDPIGIKFLPGYSDKNKLAIALAKYPDPSPAKIAADKATQSFIKYLKNQRVSNETIIKEAFKFVNIQIKKLNSKCNPNPDYLENDFWSCVACCGIIENNTLFFGYICDCGISILDTLGKIRFRTKNDMRVLDKFVKINKLNWKNPSVRKTIRSKFRNNSEKIIKKGMLSYGALTGEKTALDFVKTGKYTIEKDNFVLFYSDGMESMVYSKAFRNYLSKNKFKNLQKFCEDLCLKTKKYQKEGTLVAIQT